MVEFIERFEAFTTSVTKAYKKSCSRFNTEYLDIYLLHSPFKGYVDAYKELLKLYKEDKVKVIGVSNFDEQELEKVMAQIASDMGADPPSKEDVKDVLEHLDTDHSGKIDFTEFKVLIVDVLKAMIEDE